MGGKVVAGAERMRSLAVDLPNQLREGFRLGREADARLPRQASTAVVAGMGGSAIAADLVRGITDAETNLLLTIGRGPNLPRAAGRSSLAILTSYSGNTWETLAAYDTASRQGATRIAMTSGGTLAERAERDGVPLVVLPPGLPPRAALGYMFGGLLGVLDAYFPESNENRIERVASDLAEHQAAYSSARGAPAALAKKVGTRIPQFYGDVAFAALARRWTTQVEENAKRLAHFDAFPELLHNAIVAWDAMPKSGARRWAVVALEGATLDPSTSTGMAHLGRLLIRRGVVAERIIFKSDDRLEALLDGVSFGDHFSLHLAELGEVDPYQIDAIVRLKAAVANR
ncbi:MAG TPA: SIS domain-containing protein [Thermoplasmata archaeon]|jgi:glucose/mannose-6-phosphate isomerase|nr:SIS domain-containing protein [Thermoplasmata archaeon]